MKWIEGEIQGVVIRPVVKHADHRGWLAELFRSDETPSDILPAMSYVSVTNPGAGRGPHEHTEQTDTFGFVGPGNFRLSLWDARPCSPTSGHKMTVHVGEDNPCVVVIPPGIAHGYKNVSSMEGWVLNFPNRLFGGKGRKEPVDEVRYEDSSDSTFSLGD